MYLLQCRFVWVNSIAFHKSFLEILAFVCVFCLIYRFYTVFDFKTKFNIQFQLRKIYFLFHRVIPAKINTRLYAFYASCVCVVTNYD